MALKWNELSQLNIGDRVRFATPWDIFPECVVEAGTMGVVHDIISGQFSTVCVDIMPDNKEIRAALSEWNGCIILKSGDYDGLSPIEVVCRN